MTSNGLGGKRTHRNIEPALIWLAPGACHTMAGLFQARSGE